MADQFGHHRTITFNSSFILPTLRLAESYTHFLLFDSLSLFSISFPPGTMNEFHYRIMGTSSKMSPRAVFKSNVGLNTLRLVKSRAFSGFYKHHYERIFENQS